MNKILFILPIMITLSSCRMILDNEDYNNPGTQLKIAEELSYGGGAKYISVGDVLIHSPEGLKSHKRKEALKWYEKAVHNGNSAAMYELAQIYDPEIKRDKFSQEEAPKDKKRAMSLYSQAAELGHTNAQHTIIDFYSSGKLDNPETLNKCEERLKNINHALKLTKKYGTTGEASIYSSLGDIYHDGSCGCTANFKKAIEYYERAVERDPYNTRRQKFLADHYFTHKNFKKAFRYYKNIYNKLYGKENTEVAFKLGYMSENGLGATKDIAQAMIFYTQAANQGLIEAQHNLKVLQQRTGSFAPY